MSRDKHIVVLGLGSFGMALAVKLSENGCRVTGVDSERSRVESLKDTLFEPVIGDVTDGDTLAELAVKEADAVIISLGEDVLASLLATLRCKEQGARYLVVKAVSEDHAKILKQLGVHRPMFPEVEMARSLADQLTWPNVLDYLPIDSTYSMVEMAVPDSLNGQTLQETDLRRRFDVWIVGVKNALTGELTMFPGGEFRLNDDQLLLVMGRRKGLDRLRDLQ